MGDLATGVNRSFPAVWGWVVNLHLAYLAQSEQDHDIVAELKSQLKQNSSFHCTSR